jgi:hypothetical protein
MGKRGWGGANERTLRLIRVTQNESDLTALDDNLIDWTLRMGGTGHDTILQMASCLIQRVQQISENTDDGVA